MAGITVSLAGGLLKEFYVEGDGGPREQLNNSTVLEAQLERTADHVNAEGSEAVWDIHTSRNSGVGAIADGDSLPTAGNQTSVKARGPLRTLVGRIQMTKQTIAAAASNRSAFRKVMDDEMKGIIRDIKRQKERMNHGTGDGKIATCGTTSASTTVQLATTTTAVQLRQLQLDGIAIDIGTLASPTLRASSRTMSAFDLTNKTFTISGAAVTTASTDFVFLAGSGGTNPVKETTGLQNLVDDDSTLFGLAPATYVSWASTVDTAAANRPATEAVLRRAADAVDIASGETPNLIITSHGVERAIAADLLSRKRFSGDTVNLKGGYKGVAVDLGGREAAMVRTRDCPLNQAFLLNTDELFINEWQPWDWFDDDGQVLHYVAGKLELEAVYHWIGDLATWRRGAHARVEALSEA